MNTTSHYIPWIIASVIALLPTLIWLYFLFADSQKRKLLIALIFAGGITTVIPLLIIYKLLEKYPDYDVVRVLSGGIPSMTIVAIFVIIFHASLEEIFKQTFLRMTDSRWLLIQSVNDSIKLAMIAALGFSFAENVYTYFLPKIMAGDYKDLLGVYLVRSTFTSAMHMAVSGIFGYYYGMSKFASDFREQSKWTGEKMYLTRFITWIFHIPQSESFREQKILNGLLIAMGIHAIFNSLMQYQKIIPGLILVIGSFGYLLFLTKRKAENLILVNENMYSAEQNLSKKDEDVIIELVGIWLNEKRYQDVISICDRFLKLNPDNNVIKIFKAKATDLLEGNDAYKQTLTTLLDKKIEVEDKSVIGKWTEVQKKEGNQILTNFQNKPEFKKFLEEEEKKKAAAATFKLDLGK